LQSGHSQAGHWARSRRSLSGLTLILSNNGESFFMTDQYARAPKSHSRLEGVVAKRAY